MRKSRENAHIAPLRYRKFAVARRPFAASLR